MKKLICLFFVFVSFIGANYSLSEIINSIMIDTVKVSILDDLYLKEFNDIAKKHKVIGMGMSVVNESGTHSFYYGSSNLETNTSVDKKTLFRVASISKVVTALAVMQLIENGNIALDDDINEYLKNGIRNKYFVHDPITVRMLLSHTSSLFDGKDFEKFIAKTYSEENIPAIYGLFSPGSDIWINKKPGSYFNYCNLNYGILATIIENIANERFDRYVYENILEPLNIDGGYNVALINSRKNISVLYRHETPQADNYQNNYPVEKHYALGINGLYYSPQGGLRINITDLSKILKMLLNYGNYNGVQILEKSSVIAMESEEWMNNGNNGNTYYNHFHSWGLGLQRTIRIKKGDNIVQGLSFFGHHGDAYGLLADMYYNRDENFGFVFIVNGTSEQKGFLQGRKSRFSKLEEEIFDLAFRRHKNQ